MVRTIIEVGTPEADVLTTKCELVRDGEDVSQVIQDLFDTADKGDDEKELKALGLAANQIGSTKRVIVITGYGYRIAMVNPEIVGAKGWEVGKEHCFSEPGLCVEIGRYTKIKVKAKNFENTMKLTDMVARIVQHEIDHLDGVLLSQRAEAQKQ